MKKLCFLLLASLLAACSSSGNVVTNSLRTWDTPVSDAAQLTAQLRSPQVTPVAIDNLPFQMLSLDRNNSIDITANSPIVKLAEGNSFVAALLVPENISQFTFVLESIAGRSIFVPSVAFLDEKMNKIYAADDVQLNAKGFLFLQKTFTAEMTQNVRYIIVYSKDSDLDGRTELVDPIREYESKKGNDLSEVSYPRLYAKHSPVGNLNIRFKDVFFKATSSTTEHLAEKIKMVSAAPLAEAPAILSDTEAFYLQQISKAINEDNLPRAKSLVEEAERAGSTKAQSHYLQELEKKQQ